MSSQVITILSTKGGVGKTTLAANLSGYLFTQGFKVLMIDADYQQALTHFYSMLNKASHGLTSFYKQQADVTDCISTTGFGDLIVSDDPKKALEADVKNFPDGRVRILSQLVELRKKYDYIVIDTQGSAGALQEAAALAADRVVTPLQAASLAGSEVIRGTISLLGGLLPFQRLGVDVPPITGILWGIDHSLDSRLWSETLRGEDYSLSGALNFQIAESTVWQRVAWRNSSTHRRPVHLLAPKQDKEGKAAKELFMLAEEVLGVTHKQREAA